MMPRTLAERDMEERMKGKLITMSAPKRRPAKPSELEIESVRIEQADNGFTVSVHKRPKRAAQTDRCDVMWPEPERSVFTSADEMAAHVRGVFGGRPDKEAA